jgi:uncharacterized membrane protein YbhN (UPF0104 family)
VRHGARGGVTAILQSISTAIADANPAFVIAALGLYIVSIVIAGARWRLLLGALAIAVRLRDTMLAHLAGIFVNNVTISSRIAGEAARIGVIRLRANAPIPETTAAAAFERLSEIPPLAILIVIASPAMARSAETRIAIVCGVAFVAILVLTTPRWRNAFRDWLQRRFGQERNFLVPRAAMVQAMGWSSLAWLQDIARLWLGARALGVRLTLPQSATLSLLNLVGGWVPTLGGLGAVESGLVGGLMLFGVPFERAAAITAVERAISYGFGTTAGAVALAYAGAWRWQHPFRKTPPDHTSGRQRKNHTANTA